tara:strand:- start:628 stop:843 length:216 start_codon:yes stop_codon:yes gene_type:complete
MPGKEHTFKKHCFKMGDTGLYKKKSKKSSCSFKYKGPKFGGPKGGFMKKEEGAYKMLGMAGPMNPYSNKGK